MDDSTVVVQAAFNTVWREYTMQWVNIMFWIPLTIIQNSNQVNVYDGVLDSLNVLLKLALVPFIGF